MPTAQDDLTFAGTGMADEEFLQAWHAAVTANDEQQIAAVESAATRTWHHFYAARFPGQTRYRLPTKRQPPLIATTVGPMGRVALEPASSPMVSATVLRPG
jgi:hypothetical protein